jgi:hypothetical protein
MDYTWELRNPDGGMNGLEFARALTEAADVVLAHSLPEKVDVEVRDQDGALVAKASGLTGSAPTPMSRLELKDGTVVRTSVWPEAADLGRLVILPGGEVGTLLEWWNAPDESEWRWQVEFHNKA